jgi:queuine tRNA-ribosyltransferase
MALSWHNIAFFQAMMAAMRAAISEGRFEAWRRDMRSRWLDQPGEEIAGLTGA